MSSGDTTLGRSLKSVFSKTKPRESSRGFLELDIGLIRSTEQNPRQEFRPEALEELAQSILQHGILQPIVVIQKGDGSYEILAGERRWRAARQAGLAKVPVVVKTAVTQQELAELRLIENIQREDLNPMELADAYQALMDDYQLTQEQIAERVGKSRPHVANTLRLRQLPDDIRSLVAEGAVSGGHARCLVGLEPAHAAWLAGKIQAESLSVRAVENLAKLPMPASAGDESLQQRLAKVKPGHIRELEDKLAALLDAKVQVTERKRGGKLQIQFHSRDHFDAVVKQLEQAFESARHQSADN